MKFCRAILAVLFLGYAATAPAAPFKKGGVQGVGAAAAGQAGAVVARVSDSSAPWWNPAGLYQVREFGFGGHYGTLLGGRVDDLTVAHRGWLPEVDLAYSLGWRGVTSTGPFRFTETTVLASVAMPLTEDRRVLMGAGLKALGVSVEGAAEVAGPVRDASIRCTQQPRNRRRPAGQRDDASV